jgi:hypothetical protein
MTFVRRTATAVAAALLVGAIVLVSLLAPLGGRTGAQTEPTATPQTEAPPTSTPPFSSTLLAEAEIGPVPAGPMNLSVVTINIPPLSVTEPIANPGPVVIRVDKGTITLDAAEATIGPVLAAVGIIHPEPPMPGPANGVIIGPGQQIVLAAGTPAQIRNDGDVPATIMVIALQSEAWEASAVASPTATVVATPAAAPGDATPTT